MIEMTTLIMLACVAFSAGLFDAIAGGGGLITLPALILAGINPVNAIATNKVQAAAATISATTAFARKGLIDWAASRYIIVLSAAGGVLGALLVSLVNKNLLQAIVPVALVVIASYFAFSSSISNGQQRKRLSLPIFSFTFTPFLGMYDGFFGPGVGSFFLVGFVAICGFEVMKAMSFTKLANAACNIGSLSVFILSGLVVWPVAITMAISAFAGAQVGARLAVRVGPKLVKPMIITVCLLLAIKLLSNENNPLRQFFH